MCYLINLFDSVYWGKKLIIFKFLFLKYKFWIRELNSIKCLIFWFNDLKVIRNLFYFISWFMFENKNNKWFLLNVKMVIFWYMK